MTKEFIWPVRVYYEDTDAGGVVYYANYLKFYERARTEWLNHLAINQTELIENNIAFVVTRAEVDYLMPARLNNELLVKSQITEVRAASIRFAQAIYLKCEGGEDKLLNKGQINVACLKLSSFKPHRIPTKIREEFQRAC